MNSLPEPTTIRHICLACLLSITILTNLTAQAQHADGLIDHVALYNQKLGPQPANQDNAFVGLLLAIDTSNWDRGYCAALFTALGLTDDDVHEPLYREPDDLYPPAIDWTQTTIDDMDNPPTPPTPELAAAYEAARLRPWTAEQYPELAVWLDSVTPAFNRFEQAVSRPNYYAPAVRVPGEAETLLERPMSHLGAFKDMAEAQAARAYRAMGEGELEVAWRLNRSIFDLARRLDAEQHTVGCMVRNSLDAIALHVFGHLLNQTNISDALLSAMDAYLNDNRPTPGHLHRAIDIGERLTLKDYVANITTEDMRLLQPPTVVFQEEPEALDASLFDTQHALERIDMVFDRLDQIMRMPDPHDQLQALKQYDAERQAVLEDARNRIEGEEPATREFVTNVIIDVMVNTVIPATVSAAHTQFQIDMFYLANRTAVATAHYRRDQGDWPESLDDLVPRHLDAVPVDVFSGKALIYRVEDAGPVVYSAGRNGIDDGGTDDSDEQYLVVRLSTSVRTGD